MSATMRFYREGVVSRAWLCGVCAHLARYGSVPVWLPRLAFLMFGAMHFLLAGILYACLAYLLPAPRMKRVFTKRSFNAEAWPASADPLATLDQRLRGLDDRLCQVESAALQAESDLRRAFRNLEGRR